MYKIDFFLDKETRSHVALDAVGPVNYAAHPTTEMTLMTWAVGRTGPVRLWRPMLEPVPADIMDLAQHPEKYNFIAWNVTFDYLIWICVFSRLHGPTTFIRPSLENIHDAMALSCHFRTGASLSSAATMMKLPINKDPRGRAIMLKQCKPNAKGVYPTLTGEEQALFEHYAILDTRILRDVYYMLPPLPEPERYAWEWTFRRNLEGIRIDMDLVNELNNIVDAALPGLVAEFKAITGCIPSSPVKVKAWFQQWYPHIESMDKTVLRDLLVDTRPVPSYVRRALELKDLSGSTSISKLRTANRLVYNGRIFELLAYHHAGTKRWAGRGIQIQNFPRVNKRRPDKVDFEKNIHNLASYIHSVRPGLVDPINFVKNLLRRIWLPTPGNMFYCGDFSKVEPSVLFWFLNLGPIPKNWYEKMAGAIYNKPSEQIEEGSKERDVGKMANLSCQYQTGGDGYRKALYKETAIALSEAEGKRVVDTYRRENPAIVAFWEELQTAFRLAIHGQTSMLCGGKLHFLPMQAVFPQFKGVAIRLPSGSYLFYHAAEEAIVEVNEEVTELRFGVPVTTIVKKKRKVMRYLFDYGQGKVGWKTVYGGSICENVTSGTARDIIVPATYHLEAAGFGILGLIHDEIWGDAIAGREEEFKRLMCINPSWCNMEITSDLKCGVRYLK